MTYQLVMQERNGVELVDLVNATSRRFSFYLNRPSEFSCSISINAPEATSEYIQAGTKELIAYRNGEALETVFALTRVGVKTDADEQRLELGFEGIASYLADALIYARTSAYTGTTIPWGWINTFQSRTGGSYGITQGTQTGTPPSRTRTIEQDASILDEIINLSETGAGFDFNIDTARQYNEFHASRGNTLNIALEYGVNVRSFDYEESTAPGEIVTDVRAYGPPNSGKPRTASDTTARDTYGRREASITYMSESEDATVTSGQLQAFADAALDRSSPLIIPQVELVTNHSSIAFGTYWLGDTINFQARIASFVNIDADYRIVGIHIDLDENDNETIKLDLNAA
jgi:hypothetical protein